MHQKALSTTTSSKSSTFELSTPVQYLKGVGPKLSQLFEQKGVVTLKDALYYIPRDYQDRTKIVQIKDIPRLAQLGQNVLFSGFVTSHRFITVRTLKRPILEATVADQTGQITLKWFHYNRKFFEDKLRKQSQILAFGKPTAYMGKFSLVHPEIQWDIEDSQDEAKILPIYSETEGLNQKVIRKVIGQAIELTFKKIQDPLPQTILTKFHLLGLKEALYSLHFPSQTENSKKQIEQLQNFSTEGHRRLIFEELFLFELIVAKRRLQIRQELTQAFALPDPQLFSEVKKRFGHELTGDQSKALEKIISDLTSTKRMNRLLLGDVGCGKTLVSFYAALCAFSSRFQTALLVPTEILAEQHFKNAVKLFDGILRVELLVGSTSKSKKEALLKNLKEGEIDLLIGTHAILEDSVQFSKLGLVIIDEQHRFGVDQRMSLKNKGKNPHTLLMTATPIPRTLALTAYGDLDVTTIKEKPKGRATVVTKVVPSGSKEIIFGPIKQQLDDGRQAYVIYPLVEESEKLDLANAVSAAEELANGPLSGYRIGLLHGKMSAQDKSSVMDQFKKGTIQVLVSTSVVEVGVDVPNATILVIEHAERFGLSQLHQLRGRIGRGKHDSFCYLIHSVRSNFGSETARTRLEAMEQTNDGFRLAELDLEIRGPGDFLGTKQSGDLSFRFASLVRDAELLEDARKAAFEIILNDPELQTNENLALKRFMEDRGNLSQKRFETA
ncbi:MAG: ATP-dependent DNA helicase RecG [Bacteriovoracia bacterium]